MQYYSEKAASSKAMFGKENAVTEPAHPTGTSLVESIRGSRFELEVHARGMTCTDWNSSEYYSNTVRSYWYEGEGKLLRVGRKEPLACFLTSFGKPTSGPCTLKNVLLRITDRHLAHKSMNEWMVEGKQEQIVDFMCERMLASYRMQVGTCVPRVVLDGLTYRELVANGFAFDERGQAHLSFAA